MPSLFPTITKNAKDTFERVSSYSKGPAVGSSIPTTTPVSTAEKQKKGRQRTQPDQVTDKVLYSDLFKENDTDEKMSALIPYDPNLSDIKGTPLSH